MTRGDLAKCEAREDETTEKRLAETSDWQKREGSGKARS
jgi:hypothetical protein